MNESNKNRIAAINSGIIPEGYKKTKVGIVPLEWKQVKLGEILKQRKTLMCVSEDAPLLSFTIEEGVIEPTDKKTNKRDFLIKDISTKKFALTEVGDIIYNPANLKFGAIHRNNLRKGVVSPIYGIFYGKQDSVFMGNLLHNQRFIDYAKIYTEGTVEKLKTLKAETFLKLKVVIPPLPEQQKIAEILSTQDKLIELQEKKIEQLKALKKAYLQKMFPQKGSKYPELRFKGFTDPWEQRKLGECVTITSGEAPSKFKHGSVNYVKVDDLNYAYKTVVDTQNKVSDNPSMSKVKVGSVIFPKRGAAILTNKVRILGVESYMDTNMMALTATSLDSDFLYVLISKEGLYKIADTSTIPQINNKHIEPYEVIVPTLDEQKRIGELFAHLDILITLHQRKSEQEKQKKKALMQLLLTGKVRCK